MFACRARGRWPQEVDAPRVGGIRLVQQRMALRMPCRLHHSREAKRDHIDEAPRGEAEQDRHHREYDGVGHSAGRSGGPGPLCLEHELAARSVDPYRIAGGEPAGENGLRERVLDSLLNRPLEGTCPVDGVESRVAE